MEYQPCRFVMGDLDQEHVDMECCTEEPADIGDTHGFNDKRLI